VIYPGDSYTLLLNIPPVAGAAATITTAPLISVIQLSSGTPVVSAQPMTFVTGTTSIYSYLWNTSSLINGDYLAVVSYAANGVTYNGIFLEHVRLGDTYVTGPVALNATVALAANTATPADVAAVNPNTSSAIAAIQSAIAALPDTLATQESVNLLTSLVTDVHDYSFGTWSVNKTVSPKVLTCYSLDGSVLASSRRGLSVLRASKDLARGRARGPGVHLIPVPQVTPGIPKRLPDSPIPPCRPEPAGNHPQPGPFRPVGRGINFPVFDLPREGSWCPLFAAAYRREHHFPNLAL
jgi:hypothetical protein